MSIKIRRISIESFKPFKELSEEFGASNLIVFDGPNGFGKTSFYDAIEILFTGKIGRYSELSKDVVDKRHHIGGNPLLHTNSDGEDLIIKAELEKGGQPLFLMRKATSDALSVEVDFDNFHMDLYLLDEFDDPNPKFVRREDETELLSGYFGDNYVSNFEHLNYIEQQENIRRLKSKDLDRKKAIAHLFNTTDFNERIDRLKVAEKKLRSLCDGKAKTLLDTAKNELNERKEKFVEKGGETFYSRMISWKILPWDQESMEFSEEQFLKWMGKEGLLIEIGFFVENHDVYKAVLRNRIIADLLADEALVLEYLQFWNFLEKEPEYGEKLKRQQAIEAFLRSYEKGPLSVLENNQEGIVADLVQILNTNQFDAEEYDHAIAGIKTVRGRANNLSRLLSETKESRRLFIEKFTLLVEEKGPDGECPLCGYDWGSAEKLKSQFDAQASQLEKMISATGTELDEIIKKFQKVVYTPIKEIFEKYLKESPANVEFIARLKKASANKSKLDDFNKKLSDIKFDAVSLCNDKEAIDFPADISSLSSALIDMKQVVDTDKAPEYFDALFLDVFDQDHENVSKISAESLAAKRKYIQWQYSLYQSDIIKTEQKKYEDKEKLFSSAESEKKRITGLKKIYEASLVNYQRGLIERIEILFHIYSGRIAQESKNSLGLFIKSDNKGIRFLESHSQEHDAVFTMSSGQLAMLIISFTLALNKRFSVNQLLLIDDPVQTLDELNVAGFIELLRNDFSDHQIFISTHEDSMSTYMRYKFDKFGLKTQRLNFKETQLRITPQDTEL